LVSGIPGKVNDGAAGWGINAAKYGSTWIPQNHLQACGLWPCDGEINSGFSGAFRSAATVVVDDPIFGLFAYGGVVSNRGDAIETACRNGLRQRLHLMNFDHTLSRISVVPVAT